MPYIRIQKCVYKKNKNNSRGKKVGCSKTVPKAKKYLKKLYSLKENEEFNPQIIIDSVNSTLSELPDGHRHKNSRSARLILQKVYEILQKTNFILEKNPNLLVQDALNSIEVF